MLVAQGLAVSRHLAHALILAGDVYTGELRVEKPGQLLDAEKKLRLKQRPPYVSRGGLKLEAALLHFGIPVQGLVGLDLLPQSEDDLIERARCAVVVPAPDLVQEATSVDCIAASL